ncbi:MAG: hypothetical protein WC440_05610 [Candidatus Omnitrophota bacterium]|jgi:hypothetical protein
MKKDDETPWYKWQFSSGGLLLFVIFMISGISILFDELRLDRYVWGKLAGASFFFCLAAVIAYFEWRNRKPFRFRL